MTQNFVWVVEQWTTSEGDNVAQRSEMELSEFQRKAEIAAEPTEDDYQITRYANEDAALAHLLVVADVEEMEI